MDSLVNMTKKLLYRERQKKVTNIIVQCLHSHAERIKQIAAGVIQTKDAN
jgi:hypothetical protein